MGSSSQNTGANQASQSQSAPWQPAQGTLTNILGNINQQFPAALNQATAAQPGQLNLAQSFQGGDPTGLLNPALSAYSNQLSPILNAPLDPTKNPLLANVLSTIQNDVTNSVNQQFAGAGRDLSGMNTQTLARGLAQGEAAPLLGQYNQNVQNLMNAGSQLFGANSNVAGAEAGNMASSGGMLQQAIGMPLNALGMGANLTVPIAGLGGQTQGTANTNQNTTYNQSPVGILTALAGGANNLFGGAAPASGNIINGVGGILSKIFGPQTSYGGLY